MLSLYIVCVCVCCLHRRLCGPSIYIFNLFKREVTHQTEDNTRRITFHTININPEFISQCIFLNKRLFGLPNIFSCELFWRKQKNKPSRLTTTLQLMTIITCLWVVFDKHLSFPCGLLLTTALLVLFTERQR